MKTIATATPTPIDTMVEDPGNANKMDEEKLHTLASAILRLGFRQPVLLRRLGDGVLRIIDGHHRVRAARAAGLTEVPAGIVECTDEEARVLQLGMNRLRGEVDLAIVATNIAALVSAGLGAEDLVLTGFSTQELDALLAAAAPDNAGDNPLSGGVLGGDGGGGGGESDPDETFTLELVFGSKADVARARRGLRKAANGGELSAGLLFLLDTAQASAKKGG